MAWVFNPPVRLGVVGSPVIPYRSSMLGPPSSVGLQTLPKCVLAIIEALLDFVPRVHSAAVIVLDVRHDGVLFAFQQLKNVFDRNISGAPRYFAALAPLAVPNVHHRDLGVLLGDERNRIEARTHELSDIQIDSGER